MEKSIVMNVVGVTFENRQEILNDFFKNYRHGGKYDITLQKEDNNSFDKNAVAVYLDVNNENKHIGYISKNENEYVRKIFDNIKYARVHSIGPNRQGNLGLNIIIYFEEE